MKKFKVLMAYEIEYTVEAENEDDAYEVVQDENDSIIDKRWVHEATLEITEVKGDD